MRCKASPLPFVNFAYAESIGKYNLFNSLIFTIFEHTQHSALDSLLLLGACSNALKYGGKLRDSLMTLQRLTIRELAERK